MPAITDELIRAEFLKGWGSDQQQVKQAIAAKDMTALRDCLHRLKGALSVLALSAEAEQCQTLHHECASLSPEQVQARWEALRTAIEHHTTRWQGSVGA